MLAKNVNDNACFLNERGACEPFASKLAPTGRGCVSVRVGCFSGAPPCRYSPPPTTPVASAHSRPGPGLR
ncbi:hypothetical protein BFW90_15635 [Pseudomonas fluorescens]|nr:hypothetical protein BFW90_15635 [Pseudomonas fluorescens]